MMKTVSLIADTNNIDRVASVTQILTKIGFIDNWMVVEGDTAGEKKVDGCYYRQISHDEVKTMEHYIIKTEYLGETLLTKKPMMHNNIVYVGNKAMIDNISKLSTNNVVVHLVNKAYSNEKSYGDCITIKYTDDYRDDVIAVSILEHIKNKE